MIDVDLVGHRALRETDGGVRPQFDAQRRPILRFRGAAPAALQAVLEVGGVRSSQPVTGEARGELTLVRWPSASVTLGSGELRLEETASPARVVRRWPLVWGQPPDSLPIVAEAVGLRTSGRIGEARALLEGAWPTMDSETRLWAVVERARLHERGGVVGPAVLAWREAAELARRSGVPSEVGRRLRAAAWFAAWQRQYGVAAKLLDEADAAGRPLGDALGAAYGEYYRARIDWELGRYRLAVGRHESAIAVTRAHGDDEMAAGFGRSLAALLQDQGRHAEALAELERAAPYYETVRDDPARFSAWLVDQGIWQLRATQAGSVSPEFSRPRRLFEEALPLLERAAAPHRVGNCLLNLAWAALLEGDLAAARVAFDRAAAKPAGPGLQRVFARWLEAELLLTEGRNEAALAAFGRAEDEAREDEAGGDSDAVWRARYGLGRVHLARGDTGAALDAWREALVMLDRTARGTPIRGSRAVFLSERRALLDDTLRLLIERGAFAEAFELSDAARARVLRALTVQARVEHMSPAQLADWSAHLAAYRDARTAYEADARTGETLVASARDAWASNRRSARLDVARRFDAAWDWLEDSLGDPRPSPGGPGLMTAPALRADEALLAFVPIGADWHGFRITHTGVEHRGPTADPVAPWLPRLAEHAHVYVVDGGLAEARRLAERAPLRGAPSISFLPYAALLSSPEPPTVSGLPLVVADPGLDLPFARAEGRTLAATLPGARLLVGRDASRATVLDALRSARLFHFAGHGVLAPDQPWDAHLRLAADETLALADLIALAPHLGVAVLSGCETGIAQPLSHDERIGLPEALLTAGARAVLAADRVLPDADAARFIRAFYRHGGASAPAAALRDVIAEMRAAGDDAWRGWRVTGRR